MTFDATITQDIDQAISREWLETNGLGGWASSTISGAHSRRYHGLLVAATRPPVDRQVLLSKLDETLIVDGQRYELGCNQYPSTVQPQGYQYLTQFRRDLFPEFTYEVGDVTLRKTVVALAGENTTLIRYEVLTAVAPFALELLPLLAGRNSHDFRHADDAPQPDFTCTDDVFQIRPQPSSPELYLAIPGATYAARPLWFYQLEYAIEQERGEQSHEDLFSPGSFSRSLAPGDILHLLVSTDSPAGRDAAALLAQEQQRRTALLPPNAAPDSLARILTLAADQFIVRRDADLKTVVAGYHWFTDWGRDTMISLPGLCLTTGRLADARLILQAFAQSVSEGMLPNRFPDSGEAPEYNTVDATLWFFVAIYYYRQASADDEFVRETLLPVLLDILAWHQRGTRYGIHVAADGLLTAGEEGQQLTWMDAKVGNWVVTPRQGKAVEINALWYNALRIASTLAYDFGQPEAGQTLEQQASRLFGAFQPSFWNADRGCLYDCLTPDGSPDASIRPNQLFALSLPFPLLTGERAEQVLTVVEQHLYTPVGLRSLSPEDARYQPIYEGSLLQRDGAYHQGTVWSWLLGPYVDALLHVHGPKLGKQRAQQVLNAFAYHLREAGVGTISEIFDGQAPHHPRGCMAQAWSVAEVLRVATSLNLNI
ncbi:amylo-alpha-1,6-glucosidase [Hymenobacter crusticola]|uniref:Glycogen debranching protein n=1 Tax=Hymenobacter crusticola TaxID=1770526 RepID=A0A243WKN0_9BACT|nr:amylo-alpha-1,6-glucosidase [Hymenobacter crusticola]OUJ76160.1 glycogen debranching protein [Hymenobacter crusticola]